MKDETQQFSDETLYHRWCEGDEWAGRALIRRLSPRVYGFFARQIDLPEAEDLAQQTMINFAVNKGKCRDASKVFSYLMAIARNCLYGHLRKRSRLKAAGTRCDDDVDEYSLDEHGIGLSTALRLKDNERVLRNALHKLPLRLTIVYELRFSQEMSVPDIAKTLGIKESAVWSRIQALRKHLAKLIEDETGENLDAAGD